MFEPVPIGEQLYLFTGERQASNLVVTAHGGYVPRPAFGRQTGALRRVPGLGGWLKVPAGVSLHFYGPHKKALYNPGLSSVIKQHVVPYETLREGDTVRNYRLAKFEDDTYDNIRYGMRYRHRLVGHQMMDVLTVRNRWWGKFGLPLERVLSMLTEAGYDYEHIHCVFCRVPAIGPRPGVYARVAP